MLKKLIGVAVVATLFACSDDGDNPPDTGTNPNGDPTNACEAPEDFSACQNIVISAGNDRTSKFGSYPIVYANGDAEIGNTVVGGTRPDGSEWTGFDCRGIKVDGINTIQLKEFSVNGNTDADGVGIEISLVNLEAGETPEVSLDTIRYFTYKYKGAAHEFRMQKEEGVFWMQEVDASEDAFATVIIDTQNDDFFFDGTTAGDYDPTTVTAIQWIPSGSERPLTGTLSVADFNGYSGNQIPPKK